MKYPQTSVYTLLVNGTAVPVERAAKYRGAVVQYAAFDSDCREPSSVNWLRTSSRIVSISPQRAQIPARIQGNRLYFILEEPRYVVIRIPGHDDMFVLVDRPDPRPPGDWRRPDSLSHRLRRHRSNRTEGFHSGI